MAPLEVVLQRRRDAFADSGKISVNAGRDHLTAFSEQ